MPHIKQKMTELYGLTDKNHESKWKICNTTLSGTNKISKIKKNSKDILEMNNLP